MKSEYYLATVVNAYRRILDDGYSAALAAELECVDHRSYTTAYAFGENNNTVHYEGSQAAGTCEFVAVVRGHENGRTYVEMRNRFYENEVLEALSPTAPLAQKVTLSDLRDQSGAPCADAKLVQGVYSFSSPVALAEGDILRRRRK